jgi:hypothetical protein
MPNLGLGRGEEEERKEIAIALHAPWVFRFRGFEGMRDEEWRWGLGVWGE